MILKVAQSIFLVDAAPAATHGIQDRPAQVAVLRLDHCRFAHIVTRTPKDFVVVEENVLRMAIALVHQIYVNRTLVTVDQKKNALATPIHVHLDNANVVKAMNVHLEKLVLMVNAHLIIKFHPNRARPME